MQVIALQVQDMIDNSLLFHAKYLGSNESGSCFVNRDFLAQRLEPSEIQSLQGLWTTGAITQETLLKQLSEGEVLGEIDVEEELEATQAGGLIDMAPPEIKEREVIPTESVEPDAEAS